MAKVKSILFAGVAVATALATAPAMAGGSSYYGFGGHGLSLIHI